MHRRYAVDGTRSSGCGAVTRRNNQPAHASVRFLAINKPLSLQVARLARCEEARRGFPGRTGYERTAAALAAEGYDYRFVFSRATGHYDGKVFRPKPSPTRGLDVE